MAQKIYNKWLYALAFMFFCIPAYGQFSVLVTQQDGYYYGSYGEFTLTSTGSELPQNVTQWQSFCIELNEDVSADHQYYIDFSDKAVDGGVGGPSPDPISPETAYLYTEFLNGTLSNYNYDPGFLDRRISAKYLQDALWYLEDELDEVSGQAALWVQQAQNSGWTDTGDIMVVNLWEYDYSQGYPIRAERQSMLFGVANNIIPAPGATLLAATGIFIVGWLRKRKFV